MKFISSFFIFFVALLQATKAFPEADIPDFCKPTLKVPGSNSTTFKVLSSYKIDTSEEGGMTILYTTANPNKPEVSVKQTGTSDIWLLTVAPTGKELPKKLALLELGDLCLKKMSDNEFRIFASKPAVGYPSKNVPLPDGFIVEIGRLTQHKIGTQFKIELRGISANPHDLEGFKDLTTQR